MTQPILSSKCYAVCIGIDHYQPRSGLSSLVCAENDAKAIDAVLETLGVPADQRILLLGKQATRVAINDALNTYLLDAPQEDDFVLFYFAGHSCSLTPSEQDLIPDAKKQSDVFLASYDFDARAIRQKRSFRKSQALGMERLRRDFFEDGRARKRLFLFDSCHSGDFYGPAYRNEAEPIQSYLHEVFGQSEGRIALSSCLPNQQAREDPDLGHGLFTYYFLEALQGHAPKESYPYGYLTVGSLLQYLERALPEDQCPVRSGVEHGAFKLGYYPQFDTPSDQKHLAPQESTQAQRDAHLHALLHDHRSFLADRLESFVGRITELADIRYRIAEKMSTGGYVTITGQAGQGKSSIIAKLIEVYGAETVAYHFIPFNPGPDHQVGILRNLMARLILKYHLSDLYVAAENRAALRDYFPNVLREVTITGNQEVIFIDGLDQIEEDMNGVRDLSFLPNNPPAGIVFVLGTRPNDTLQPLELLKPHDQYPLPNLRREDFDLMLQHRHLSLASTLVDQFYQAMQENALYLDLVAKELQEDTILSPQSMIAQIANNPENIFSLSITRLKRRPMEWREVIKPVLGLLLTSREPLSFWHIRQILHVDDDQLRDGIARVGGLVRETGQRRYTLFHLKFQDYLRQDEHQLHQEYVFAIDEEEQWHVAFVKWCELEPFSRIWEDVHEKREQGRREYARQHYIAHLYAAKAYEKIFDVLDKGTYGRAKEQYDRRARSYIQDLDLGRRALVLPERAFEERLHLLPLLWRYTLLRGSLRSQVDQYPENLFYVLLLFEKETEVLGLAELMTQTRAKIRVLLQIALHIAQYPIRQQESIQIFLRASSLAQQIEHYDEKVSALCAVIDALVQVQEWARASAMLVQAEALVQQIEGSYKKASALGLVARTLARAQEWTRAEAVLQQIERYDAKALALCAIAEALVQIQESERAKAMLAQAEAVVQQIEWSDEKAPVMRKIAEILVHVREWERAEALVQQIEERDEQVVALCVVAEALMHMQEWERARVEITRAEELLQQIEGESYRKMAVLRAVAQALAHVQEWERAESLAQQIEGSYLKASALCSVAEALVHAQEWERARSVLTQAERVALHIEGHDEKMLELCVVSEALSHTQHWERAEQVAQQIDVSDLKVAALHTLFESLTQAQEWERAEAVLQQIGVSDLKVSSLCEVAEVLVHAQEWERARVVLLQAEEIAQQIEKSDEKVSALCLVAEMSIHAQEWERARVVLVQAEAIVPQIADKDEKASALREIVEALAQAREWEQTEDLVQQIEVSDEKALALRKIAGSLASVQEWERAEKIAQQIKGSYEKASALREIVEALAHAQEWERAEEIAQQIEMSDEKASALCKIVEALARAQEWARAEEVVQQIEVRDMKALALCAVASALAHAQEWERAEAVVQQIEWRDAKALALCAVANTLVQIQELERARAMLARAEKVALQIEGSNANILQTVVESLLQAQDWK